MFIGSYWLARRRVRTDFRRMRNLDALGLKPAPGVVQAAPYAGIVLRKTLTRQQTHECGGCCAKDNRASHLCHEVTLLRIDAHAQIGTQIRTLRASARLHARTISNAERTDRKEVGLFEYRARRQHGRRPFSHRNGNSAYPLK